MGGSPWENVEIGLKVRNGVKFYLKLYKKIKMGKKLKWYKN